MSWLDGLPNWGPFRRGGAAVADREEATNDAGGLDSGPPLMLLVNDASGRASFKTHVFPDAESATDFVLYWFPNQSQGGIIAFWAMTQAPDSGLDSPSETAPEAVVMIRDVTRDGVVYLFSFVDMEPARTFLREEARHGTDLGVMMLYWAVPVRLTADPWGKMVLTPSVPPGTVYDVETEVPSKDVWSPSPTPLAMEIERLDPDEEALNVFEEAPNAHTGVADPMGGIDDSYELTSWVESSAKKRPVDRSSEPEAKAPPARGQALFHGDEQEVPVEERPVAAAPEAPEETRMSFEPAVQEPEAMPTAQPEAPEEPEAVMKPAPEEVLEAAPILDDAAPEAPSTAPVMEDSVAPDEGTEDEPAASGMETVEEHPSIELRGSITRVHTNGNGHKPAPAEEDSRDASGDEDQKPPRKVQGNGYKPDEVGGLVHDAGPVEDAAGAPSGEAAATPVEHAEDERDENGHTGPGVDIRIDIHLESSRNMKIKRWEIKKEPFEGFDSPPGRF